MWPCSCFSAVVFLSRDICQCTLSTTAWMMRSSSSSPLPLSKGIGTAPARLESSWAWKGVLEHSVNNAKVVGLIPVQAVHWRVGLAHPCRCPPTQNILWFYAIIHVKKRGGKRWSNLNTSNVGEWSNTCLHAPLCRTLLELLFTQGVTIMSECFSQWKIETSVVFRTTCLDCTFQTKQLALL